MKKNKILVCLMSIYLFTSCTNGGDSIAHWESWDMPVTELKDGKMQVTATWKVWKKDNIEYQDQNSDGVIDWRIENKGSVQIKWHDTNSDGKFDLEYVFTEGTIDPAKDVRKISISVPRTN